MENLIWTKIGMSMVEWRSLPLDERLAILKANGHDVSRSPESTFSASAAAACARPEGAARLTTPVPTSSNGSLYGRAPVQSKQGGA